MEDFKFEIVLCKMSSVLTLDQREFKLAPIPNEKRTETKLCNARVIVHNFNF